MPTRSKARNLSLPLPSPALARRTAERKAKAAEDGAKQDDNNSEVAQLRQQVASMAAELEAARSRISELEHEVHSATDAEEAVRALLTSAYDTIAQLETVDDDQTAALGSRKVSTIA